MWEFFLLGLKSKFSKIKCLHLCDALGSSSVSSFAVERRVDISRIKCLHVSVVPLGGRKPPNAARWNMLGSRSSQHYDHYHYYHYDRDDGYSDYNDDPLLITHEVCSDLLCDHDYHNYAHPK